MLFSSDDSTLTSEDKINFVYQEARKQQTDRILNQIWKWSFRILTIGSLLYIYLNPGYLSNMIQSTVGTTLKSSASSMVGLPPDLAEWKINPETLKKALEMYKKASGEKASY